jgi:DNA-binding CsgD family transcriptional regulator
LDVLEEAVRLLEEATRLIRAHRDGRPAVEAWRLTDRESDVLKLLREGRSNEEIAAALEISVHTARTHVSRVLAKLYVRSRWQLLDVVSDVRVRLVSSRRPSLAAVGQLRRQVGRRRHPAEEAVG